MFSTYNNNNSLKEVLNGKFPENYVKKMGRKSLENFVLKLVECSSDASVKNVESFIGLYKSLCLNQINKPAWWPSEKIIEQSLTNDGKYFMEMLRFLVYKCCEFFKKPCGSLNEKIFVNDNDENCRGIKRKHHETDSVEVPNKRRLLMPQNVGLATSKSVTKINGTIIQSPIIRLKDIFLKSKPKPLKQHQFLKIFGLQSNFDSSPEKSHVWVGSTSSLKINACPSIPFSSDLGRELLKRENHIFPEYLKSRKLERLEWYVNQPHSHFVDIEYPVCYQNKKDISYRNFKFPKRNVWQHPGDVEYQKKIHFCKPLKVILVQTNLETMKKELDQKYQRQLIVVISKMSIPCVKHQVDHQSENKINVIQTLRHKKQRKTL